MGVKRKNGVNVVDRETERKRHERERSDMVEWETKKEKKKMITTRKGEYDKDLLKKEDGINAVGLIRG